MVYEWQSYQMNNQRRNCLQFGTRTLKKTMLIKCLIYMWILVYPQKMKDDKSERNKVICQTINTQYLGRDILEACKIENVL